MMAYGMLTSFALGAAEGLGNAVVNKVGRMQEEELKAKIEAEREQRIEEAAIRAEGRKQTWETNPENPSYQASMSKLDSAALEKKLAEQKLAAGAKDLSNYDENQSRKALEDEAKVAQMKASTSKTLSDISINQAEADQKQKVYRAGDDLAAAVQSGDQQAIDQATKNYKAIAGKDIEKSQLKAVDIPTGETDKQGKPVVITKLFRVYGDNSAEEIKTTSANIPKTPEQINEQAIAVANSLSDGKVYFNSLDEAQKYKGEDWYKPMTKDEKTNRETWLSNYGKAMVDQSYEGGKAPSGKGMLNSGKAPIDDLYKGDINVAGLRKAGSSEFEKSKGLAADLEADSNQLQRYATKSPITGKPITTLRETISTWSPKSENDTERLVNDAAKLLNIKPDDKIDLNDSATRGQILKALVKQEHGGQIKSDINKIYNYIDETYGSEPLKSSTTPDFSKFKFVGSR